MSRHFASINSGRVTGTVDNPGPGVVVANNVSICQAPFPGLQWVETYDPSNPPSAAELQADNSVVVATRNYAGRGFEIHPSGPATAFVAPKPYPSWVLNGASTNYVAPVAPPIYDPATQTIVWDEKTISFTVLSLLTGLPVSQTAIAGAK